MLGQNLLQFSTSVCPLSPNTEHNMASVKLLLLLALVPLTMSQYVYEEPLLYDTFPDDFLWGVATSAYQVKFSAMSVS